MRTRRSGFSLVLSLTVMAAMVLMVVVLASFLQIESRLALSHAGYMRARLNALASAKIAIGQLQQLAGPDQRVTMRADMYADNDKPVGGTDADTIAYTLPGSGTKYNGNNAPQGGKLSHQKRYLTGVWATGGVDSSRVRDWDVTNPIESRLFLGWLSSSFVANADSELSGDAPNYVPNRSYFTTNGGATGKRRKADMTEGQALINSLSTAIEANNPETVLVPLVSYGTISMPTGINSFQRNYFGTVDARPQPMPGPAFASATARLGPNGRYAFWVGDEGVKAKVNLPDSYASTAGGAWLSTEDWDKGFAGSANQRNGIAAIASAGSNLYVGSATNNPRGALPAGFNFEKWRANDINSASGNPQAYLLATCSSPASVTAWAAKQDGLAASQAMNDALKVLWHDVTTYSYSTLTDTYNGGVKMDLSAAFELPYSQYRGLEVYPGQKNSSITTLPAQRRASFFHGAPNLFNSTGTIDYGIGVDLDYNRPNLVDTLGSDSQLLLASPHASEWAGRYLVKSNSNFLGQSYAKLKTQNGGESPERLGFVYEAPLRSALFTPSTGFRDVANQETSNNASGTAILRVNSNAFSESLTDGPENIAGRITRGPTWDLYRSYYRKYKRENEAAMAVSSSAMRGQANPTTPDTVIAHGVEPLSFATGNRNQPFQRSRIPVNSPPFTTAPVPGSFYTSGATDPNKYRYRNNFSGPSDTPLFQAEQRLRYPNILINKYAAGVMNFDRLGLAKPTVTTAMANPDAVFDTPQPLSTRTWPTTMGLMPSIIRFSMIFSGVVDTDAIGVVIDPVLVVHNPYDCPIEFEGIAMVTNGQSVPYIFDIQLQNWTYNSTENQYAQPVAGSRSMTDPKKKALRTVADPWLKTVRENVTIGDIALGEGDLDNRSFSFRVLASSGQKYRLEPGEIKVLSTPASSSTAYTSTREKNTVIFGDTGFDCGSKAMYKMTPFAHVRYRQNNDITTQMRTLTTYPWVVGAGPPSNPTPDSRLWSWAFTPLSPSLGKAYYDTTTFDLPDCQFIGDYCTNYLTDPYDPNILTLWGRVQSARKVHDALPAWDGSAQSLNYIFYNAAANPNNPQPQLTFSMRNTGLVNYDGGIVGEEGANYSTDKPTPTATYPNPAPYVLPRLRSGSTNLGGHQAWNFYLIGNKSIDGKDLNPNRRWFGSPDNVSNGLTASNINTSNYPYEGKDTAPGVHLVDEPLLLSFNALTPGWPQYGNDSWWSSVLVPNNEYVRWRNPPGTPVPPDYRVATGTKVDSPAAGTDSTNNVYGTKYSGGDPEFKLPEINGSRSGTLNGRVNASILTTPGVLGKKQQFFIADFVLRSADMSSDQNYQWYPKDSTTQFPGAAAFTGSPTAWVGRSTGWETLITPPEMLNAPMSPFFLSVRPQSAHLFAYDGKAHTPIGWVLSMKPLTYGTGTYGILPVSTNKQNAYWGSSVNEPSPGSRKDVILFPIPRRPLLSLAQLGSVGYAQVITDADFTVGSSFANPGITDLTKITEWPGPKDGTTEDPATPENGYVAKTEGTRVVRNFAQVRTDHAFAANIALWDSFYFSGLNLQAPSYSIPAFKSNFPGGPDLPTDSSIATAQTSALKKATGNNSLDPTSFADIKSALNAGYNPLANKRVKFIPDGLPASTADFPEPTEFPHPAYFARNALYDGGFNVNSTSKAAWKAVLAGMRGQTLPDGSFTSGTVLTRFARSFKPSGSTTAWNDYRELTDAEIEELASLVVKEVRDRGPFMSLGDFVNRRLLNADTGLKGALQAAIDNSKINDQTIGDAGGTYAHPPAPDFSKAIGRNDTFNYKEDNIWAFMQNAPGSVNASAPRFPRLAAYKPTGKASDNPIGLNGVTAGLGAPKLLTQMDILNTVGPNLTARSDTFTIRAYGEALDNNGNTIGRAWVEVVVQRTPSYMIPASRGPAYEESTRRKLNYRPKTKADPTFTYNYDNDPIVDMYEAIADPNTNLPKTGASTATQIEKDAWKVNRILGRRFKPTSLRWLNPNEI